jgi:predicted SprT family Zn-dependent metalloprotease
MTTFAQIARLYVELSEQVKQKHPCLQAWDVTWNPRLNCAMGRAVRSPKGTKKIELSSKIVSLNLTVPNFLDRVKETILHEWAHALDWELYQNWGHGQTWRNCMMSFGLRPKRCYDSELFLYHPKTYNYAIRNRDTGRVFVYLRKYPVNEILTNAHHWHRIELMRPASEELELVHLSSGHSTLIP